MNSGSLTYTRASFTGSDETYTAGELVPYAPQVVARNDLAVTPRGDVYVTDSLRPVLYRIPAGERRTSGVEALPVALDFTGTALQYAPGFNVNGIDATVGRLILVQSNTGKLFT